MRHPALALLLAALLGAPAVSAQGPADAPHVTDAEGDAAYAGGATQPQGNEGTRTQLDLVSALFSAPDDDTVRVALRVGALPGERGCSECLWAVSWELDDGTRWAAYVLREPASAVDPSNPGLPDVSRLTRVEQTFALGHRVEGAGVPVEHVVNVQAQTTPDLPGWVLTFPREAMGADANATLARTAAESWYSLPEEEGWVASDRAPDCGDGDACAYGRAFVSRVPEPDDEREAPPPAEGNATDEGGAGLPQGNASTPDRGGQSQGEDAGGADDDEAPPTSGDVTRAQASGEERALPWWLGNVLGAASGGALLLIAWGLARLLGGRRGARA